MASSKLSTHVKQSFVLGLPVVVSQLLQMGIGVTDALMVARLGEVELAQITLGTQFLFLLQLAMLGFQIAISVLGGPALAAGDTQTTRRALRMGIWQCFMFFVLVLWISRYSREILRAIDQPAEAIDGAVLYIGVAVWALLPAFLLNALRNYLLVLEKNASLMALSLVAFVINIIGNYALIFGKLGAPALGLVGSAWATVATHVLYLLVMFLIVKRDPRSREIHLFRRLWVFDAEIFTKLLRLGLPTSVGLLSEVGMFQFATVMVGWIGISELAAHGLILYVSSVTFMVPLGFSIVCSIRAGKAKGREDRHDLIRVAQSTTILIMSVMAMTAIVFWFWPESVVGLLLDDNHADVSTVAALAAGYLMFAGLFQLGDGAQVTAMGLLRGLQDVMVPAVLAFVGYWLVGVPAGYLLAFHFGFGGQGVWGGLALGLTFTAVLLWSRFLWQLKRFPA